MTAEGLLDPRMRRPGARPPAARRTARVLLVDDEAIVRFGLRQLFATDPELAVVGEAATARDALALADRCPPDLVVLDVELGATARASTSLAGCSSATPVSSC
jgi:two-component system, NarL family, response regulator DevR